MDLPELKQEFHTFWPSVDKSARDIVSVYPEKTNGGTQRWGGVASSSVRKFSAMMLRKSNIYEKYGLIMKESISKK